MCVCAREGSDNSEAECVTVTHRQPHGMLDKVSTNAMFLLITIVAVAVSTYTLSVITMHVTIFNYFTVY